MEVHLAGIRRLAWLDLRIYCEVACCAVSSCRGSKIAGMGRKSLAGLCPVIRPRPVRRRPGNINHPKGHPLASRDYQDRLGLVATSPCGRPMGCSAISISIPSTRWPNSSLWDAQHAPENVGFSHNVQARTVRQGTKRSSRQFSKYTASTWWPTRPRPAVCSKNCRPVAWPGAAHKSLGTLTIEDTAQARPDLLRQIEQQTSAEMVRLRRRVDDWKPPRISATSTRPRQPIVGRVSSARPGSRQDQKRGGQRVCSCRRCWPRSTKWRFANWWPSGRDWSRRGRPGRRQRPPRKTVNPASRRSAKLRSGGSTTTEEFAGRFSGVSTSTFRIARAELGRACAGDRRSSNLVFDIDRSPPHQTPSHFFAENRAMTDTMRWRYGDTNPVVTKPIAAGVTIQIGDLLGQDRAATSRRPMRPTWTTDLPTTQGRVPHRLSWAWPCNARSADTDPIRVATSGVFEMASLLRRSTWGTWSGRPKTPATCC